MLVMERMEKGIFQVQVNVKAESEMARKNGVVNEEAVRRSYLLCFDAKARMRHGGKEQAAVGLWHL